jgi:molybdenum cofactor cytidylyltransferase
MPDPGSHVVSELGPESDPVPRIAALILAAGASRRLGQPKQLLRVAGETLLRRTARLALEAGCAPVLAVLGHAAGQMRPEVDSPPIHAIFNEKWEEGMGSSLRCGVSALVEFRPKVDDLLVLVCDQPRLTADHLRALLGLHHASDALITASYYADQSGVPAIFAAELFPQLQAAQGDRGARELIRQQAARTQTVDWPDGAFDLDHPEQLNGLTET